MGHPRARFGIVVPRKAWLPLGEVSQMPRLTWYAVLFACFALSPFAEKASAFQAAPGDSVQSRPPQLIPRTHEDRESRFITEHRIILNVRVSDNAGKPLSDLQESDF